jgi:hypothetical protein
VVAVFYYSNSGHPLGYRHENFQDSKYDSRGRLQYDVVYTFEKNGLCRYNPLNDRPPLPKQKHALFFGCSFVFGLWLADNETIAYWFSLYYPQYRTYNYAYSGYGPHRSLELVRAHNIRRIINEDHGIALYGYISDQVPRVAGTAHWMSYPDAPCFFINKKGQLACKGSFRKTRPVRTLFLTAWDYIFKYIHHDEYTWNMPRVTEKDYVLTVRIILELKNEYLKHFPHGRFIVLLYPESATDPYIRKYLREYQLEYVDMAELLPFKRGTQAYQKYFSNDGHPTGALNRTIIRMIYTHKLI